MWDSLFVVFVVVWLTDRDVLAANLPDVADVTLFLSCGTAEILFVLPQPITDAMPLSIAWMYLLLQFFVFLVDRVPIQFVPGNDEAAEGQLSMDSRQTMVS